MSRRASFGFSSEARLRRFLRAAWVALIASLAAGTPAGGALAAAPGAAVAPAPIAVRAVTAASTAATSRVIDALEAAGYRVHVVLLPSTYYVSGGATARALPAGVRALDAAPAPMPPASDAAADRPGDADPFGGRADALPPLHPDAGARVKAARSGIAPPGSTLPPGLPYGALWEDTSEFMIGRVAVPILFTESDGTIDPNHFDWTPALRDSVVGSAVRGLLKWSVLAATRNIPLTFLVEPHLGVATKYEPIDHPIAQELVWMEDALEPLLGYKGSAIPMIYDYANAARARLSAQWASVVFAVQNDTSATGTFPDGYIAHSNLGGPYIVMPVNNLNTRSASLDYYFEHEMTHQFWALDEYPALNAWWACTLTTGYFNRPNRNSSVPADGYCGIPTVHCLMKGNYPDDWCAYTTDQIGWADLDGNGIIDLYETRPVVRPDSTIYRTGAGQALTLRGEADEAALPNLNPYHSGAGDSVSIAVIDSIEYRVDSGAWVPIPCGDGRCDSGAEPFTLTLAPLSIGTHSVEYRAWNTSGRTALVPSGTSITISGGTGAIGGTDGGDAAPHLVVAPAPARGGARFRLAAAPGARFRADLIDLGGRATRRWDLTMPGGGSLEWIWDGRAEGGGPAAAGLYFLVVRIGTFTATQRVVLLR